AGNAHTLAFDDAYFDTVVATFVLCTIPEPRLAAQEMARVLKPTGRLIFAEHVCAGDHRVRRLQRGVAPVWSRVAGGCRLDNDAQTQLQDAGFALNVLSSPRS